MSEGPAFFEPIRQRAAARWDQLERDPELAGPWHQLFKQVQSPRHILSELLQNADDAGATEASVYIQGRTFIFTHNGEDFKEEHFASLCRFGYSNKRALHTIGFRGIGFKSTFSLGNVVELYTPTLSVCFDQKRFTEPKWVMSPPNTYGQTCIRVEICDENRQHEVEKNLQEWLTSPVSLLFFKHIRRLQIGDKKVHWGSLGPGPVADTEWMALDNDPDQAFLVARSSAEPFPSNALQEIKQERLLGDDQGTDFPPCRVEIVLGAKGRLYVVLPTGVETPLPFACNAPFIQDPARLKIKDPETSPTNSWLLDRAGALAASVMLRWLNQSNASLAERASAYRIFPNVNRADNSLEGVCGAMAEEAFGAAIIGTNFLLTEAGELKAGGQSVAIPEEIFDVWPPEQAALLIDEAKRPAFSRYVSRNDLEKIVKWGGIDRFDKSHIVNVLQTKHLPKPENWGALLNLWAYVAPELTGYRRNVSREVVRILPVQGKDMLYSANEVVRLGERRLLQAESDWEFLAAHLLVLNQNWPRFLAELRRSVDGKDKKDVRDDVEAAFAILEAIGLEEASDVSEVIEQVASDFFGQESITLHETIQLAQIAAKLGATVDESFRFATQDKKLHASDHIVLYDQDGSLEEMFPDTWCASHILHAEYLRDFRSCGQEEWNRWISSGAAKLHTFAPLSQVRPSIWGRQKLVAELGRRGFGGTPIYPYVTNQFLIEDWDFHPDHWLHWEHLAKDDPNLWGRLAGRILAQPENFWLKAKNARVVQVATSGGKKAITTEPLLPEWILKLRNLPCLPDTRGYYRKPSELLRRTLETEAFMDVEPFVHGRLDTEATRPLLKLLGVRETPTDPNRVLDCLRALAKSGNPPIYEVEKWYRRLDQMADTCSTEEFGNIKQALREEKIILTESGEWSAASGVFLSSDEQDVPGAAVIRSSVRDLTLWRKVDIAERPTAELAIRWLKELPSGEPLSQDNLRRIQSLLSRHAIRIWNECSHWINLAGEWAPVVTLNYSLSMQSLVPWKHLHEWVKQQTADLQRLPVDVIQTVPFSNLPHLGGQIEERLNPNLFSKGIPEQKPWLVRFGAELRRIELDSELESKRARELGADLMMTSWQTTPGLEIIPYIGGTPAGTPRHAEVVWLDRVLYVERLSQAKLARLVPDRLGKEFNSLDITAALNYCFGRSPEEVTEYLEENFKLMPMDERELEHACDSEDVECAASSQNGLLKPDGESAHEFMLGNESDQIRKFAGDDQSVPEAESSTDLDQLDPVEPKPKNTQPYSRPVKPSIIERFAHGQGFRNDGESRFFHSNGSWIVKTNGEAFPWERRNSTGEILQYLWAKDVCLEREPLQLDADIWALIDKFPKKYSVILSNLRGDPIELTGTRLRAMRDGGDLTLHPATYRLVLGRNNG